MEKTVVNSNEFQRLILLLQQNPSLLNALTPEQLPEMVQILRAGIREKCRKNLFFLCKYILGFSDMTAQFHGPTCKKLQKVNKYVKNRKKYKFIPARIRNKLWMIFRGSFKTTVLTVGHTIQLILVDPNIRICIASNKLDNSKGMLLQIKQQFMQNQLFRFLFTEFCPVANQEGKIEWGTGSAVTVLNRDDITLKEATIECAGVDTGLVSRHYDYIKKDDLVTEKSVTTAEQIEASINWDRMSISLYDAAEKGFCDWIGTRYDERDLYGHIEKRPKNRITQTHIAAEDEFGTPAFPERLGKAGLAEIREDQGEYIFSCQYLLRPIAKADQVFFDDWFVEYDKLPDYFAVCIFVDPAASRKKSAKFTAMCVHALARVDGTLKWFLIDGVFDKLNSSDRVNALFHLARKWKQWLRVVSYETIGFQDTDRYNIERKMKEEDFYFHINKVEAQDNTKLGRIQGMVPWYEYGKVLFPKKINYYSKYYRKTIDIVKVIKYELTRFPQSEHLDFIDAQSQQLRFGYIAPTKAVYKRKVPYNSFHGVRNRLIRAKKAGTIHGRTMWRDLCRSVPES